MAKSTPAKSTSAPAATASPAAGESSASQAAPSTFWQQYRQTQAVSLALNPTGENKKGAGVSGRTYAPGNRRDQRELDAALTKAQREHLIAKGVFVRIADEDSAA